MFAFKNSRKCLRKSQVISFVHLPHFSFHILICIRIKYDKTWIKFETIAIKLNDHDNIKNKTCQNNLIQYTFDFGFVGKVFLLKL